MPNVKSEPKLENFILKPGHKHHGFKDGKRHWYVGSEKGNNIVELNAEQAKAFGDKFVSKREYETRLRVEEEMTKAPTPANNTEELEELKKKLDEANKATAAAEQAAKEAKAEAVAAEKAKAEAESQAESARAEADKAKAAAEATKGETTEKPTSSTVSKVIPLVTK